MKEEHFEKKVEYIPLVKEERRAQVVQKTRARLLIVVHTTSGELRRDFVDIYIAE